MILIFINPSKLKALFFNLRTISDFWLKDFWFSYRIFFSHSYILSRRANMLAKRAKMVARQAKIYLTRNGKKLHIKIKILFFKSFILSQGSKNKHHCINSSRIFPCAYVLSSILYLWIMKKMKCRKVVWLRLLLVNFLLVSLLYILQHLFPPPEIKIMLRKKASKS